LAGRSPSGGYHAPVGDRRCIAGLLHAAQSTSTSKKAAPASDVESASSRRTRAEVILNRRNEVILKLREIAQRTGDDALLRKADELQERAWDLYLEKTPGPGGSVQEERK
jgi:hypothetical protein